MLSSMATFLSVRDIPEWAIIGERWHAVERWWSRDGEIRGATVCGSFIARSTVDVRRGEAPTCPVCEHLHPRSVRQAAQ